MCDPVSIGVAGLVMTAGSTIAGMSAAKQQGEAQAAAARDQAAAEAERARIQAEGNAGAARANAFSNQIASLLSAQKSQAEMDALEYNAMVADNNQKLALKSAESAMISGANKAQLEFQRTWKIRSTQAAAMSANGMDIGAGSPLDVLTDSARVAYLDKALGEYDAANNTWAFKNQANDYSAQSALLRMQRDNAAMARDNALLSAEYSRLGGEVGYYGALAAGDRAAQTYLNSGVVASNNALAAGRANANAVLLNGVSSMASTGLGMYNTGVFAPKISTFKIPGGPPNTRVPGYPGK